MRIDHCQLLVAACLFYSACQSESPGMPDSAPPDARSTDAQPSCGNGVLEADEECDDEDLGGNTCESLGYAGGALACEPWRCRFDVTGCADSPTCGDGAVDPLEECDDGNDEPWDGCTACRITEFRINSDEYGYCEESAVAVGMGGDILVAFQGCFCGEDPCFCFLFGRRLDAAARFLGPDFELPIDYGPEQANPAVAALSAGGFATTWWSWHFDPALAGIFGQLYQANGQEQGSMFKANDLPAGHYPAPAVAATETGFVVVWHGPQNATDGHLWGQRFDADGIALGVGP